MNLKYTPELFLVGLLVVASGPQGLCQPTAGLLKPISGVVLDIGTGKPIGNVRVLVSSPSIEMRGLQDGRPGLYDARTDAEGRFTIQAPPSEKISFNAFSPGYEEAAGLWMSGNWTLHAVPFPSSENQEFTIKLRPALYMAGIVVDESGRPIAGARTGATLSDKSGLGYVCFGTTGTNGSFEVFDFPLKLSDYSDKADARGQLTFELSDGLRTIITNVYTLSEAERTNLQVTMRRGHDVKGLLTASGGRPLANTIVEIVPADESAARKMEPTDAYGRFLIRGLPDGEATIRAHSVKFDQKAKKKMQLAGADVEINLELKPVVLTNPPTVYTLLGMKLAEMTPELEDVYDLYAARGVLILDAESNDVKLEGGAFCQGECIWMIGNKVTSNLRQMVSELLRISELDREIDPNEGYRESMRIAYDTLRGAGTYTTRLKLTDENIAELKKFAASLPPGGSRD